MFLGNRGHMRPIWTAGLIIASLLLLLLLLLPLRGEASEAPVKRTPPRLNGQRFRITAIDAGNFLHIPKNDEADIPSGYLIDMLREVAARANFTYDLLTPSGFGSQCDPQQDVAFLENDSDPTAGANESANDEIAATPYSEHYHTQYKCGVDDVVELQGTNAATDMYWGLYYLTPERQIDAWFTLPYKPPSRSTPVMFGTTSGIPTIQDLIEQQKAGKQPPACIPASSATADAIKSAFPDLKTKPFVGEEVDIYDSMASGECPIHIEDVLLASRFVRKQSEKQRCLAAGKPIGVIGEPMDSGYSHFAMGVGRHLDRKVVDTIDYWINVLMVDGTLASFYKGVGAGTGNECGYDLLPGESESRLLPEWAIAIVTLAAVGLVIISLCTWYRYRLKQQEKRYKKRFVQQIARNIEIGRRPGCISPEKLSEEILHIGEGKESISKEDLSKWMHDIKMDFISQKDFDALWDAMDVDDSGEVDAVEFVVFLSACGPEFEQVYKDLENMPKLERLKLAARRLTNLKKYGEEGVRRIEHNLETSSRTAAKPRSSRTRKTCMDSLTSEHSQEPSVKSHEDSLLGTDR